MNIHYFGSESWEESYVRTKLPNANITFHEKSLGAYPDLTDTTAEALCIFIDSHIGKEELDRFPSVKLIATRSTGFDHVDIALTKERGVTLVTVPFYGENTVAEFAFALLLSLSRRIPEAHTRVQGGTFSPTGLRGFDLSGKTIGIVGTGHIGAHMIRMSKGFGMKVIAFDAFPNLELSHTLDFNYVPLTELLQNSDIITLHVPYNKETHHLINKENISFIKKGAYLINTARGAVIETDALVQALENETLAGAALDVLEEENDLTDEMALLSSSEPNTDALKVTLENHYLIEHPRVIITPHLAFNTIEAVQRIVDTTTDNILQFEAGTPTNVIS
jgi:D-lactate dehydrogenase